MSVSGVAHKTNRPDTDSAVVHRLLALIIKKSRVRFKQGRKHPGQMTADYLTPHDMTELTRTSGLVRATHPDVVAAPTDERAAYRSFLVEVALDTLKKRGVIVDDMWGHVRLAQWALDALSATMRSAPADADTPQQANARARKAAEVLLRQL